MERQAFFHRTDGCGTHYWVNIPSILIRAAAYATLALPFAVLALLVVATLRLA